MVSSRCALYVSYVDVLDYEILFQEFYTSSESNIHDAKGQDALVSLVGTIGSGLTWSGGIFVNPLMAKVENLRFITLFGAFVMSLGIFLASFSTKVICREHVYSMKLSFIIFLAMASLHDAGAALRCRLIHVLLPYYVSHADLF